MATYSRAKVSAFSPTSINSCAIAVAHDAKARKVSQPTSTATATTSAATARSSSSEGNAFHCASTPYRTHPPAGKKAKPDRRADPCSINAPSPAGAILAGSTSITIRSPSSSRKAISAPPFATDFVEHGSSRGSGAVLRAVEQPPEHHHRGAFMISFQALVLPGRSSVSAMATQSELRSAITSPRLIVGVRHETPSVVIRTASCCDRPQAPRSAGFAASSHPRPQRASLPSASLCVAEGPLWSTRQPRSGT